MKKEAVPKSGTEEAMAPFATRLERRNPLLSRLLKDVATPLIASGCLKGQKQTFLDTPFLNCFKL